MTDSDHDTMLSSLRRAEPIAVLASLTLVITVFTLDKQAEFQGIYNYSTTATFMFIISFLFAVISEVVFVKRAPKMFEWFRFWLTGLGMYFFLGIGMIYLLLIAADFAARGSQVFSFVYGYVALFFAASDILLYKMMQQKAMVFL